MISALHPLGTPFRTERDPIVFVPSEGGSAKPDYTYGYEGAIRDEACRPVRFVHAKGSTTFTTQDGRTHTVSFDDLLTEQGERKRFRTALEVVTPSSIADTMLSSAND